jgi:CMP-N,N'-diacetyllegionaminic acid synthase
MPSLGKILAVIPARGGSKGVPRKNIRLIAGKPLIAYTINTALKAKHLFHRVIVSTDDEEIATVAKEYGAEVPFLRHMELSTDKASMVPVLRHAVQYIERQDGIHLDWILLLQPTEPLRKISDIQKAMEIASKGDCDSVISVKRVFAHHPILMKKIDNGKLVPFIVEEKEGTCRQDYYPPAYMRNGSVYLTRRDTLMKQNSIWGKTAKPLITNEGDSVSIDTENDAKLAEILIKERINGQG